MKADRNRVPYLFFATLTIFPAAAQFAGTLRAQSAEGAASTVLRAVPDGDARAESGSNPGEHWMNHPALVDPSPDMKCAVVEWIAASPKPSLVVVCPPDEVFAPLRLYFKLSWKRDADVPGDLQIIATPKAMTKMHWSMHGDYQVLLRAERKNERNARPAWVKFNDLVGVYIKSE